MSSSSETFCPLAYTKLKINSDGTMAVCCFTGTLLRDESGRALHVDTTDLIDAWRGHDLARLRADLAGGRRNAHCDGCYAMEAMGQRSYRQLMISEMLSGREAFDHIDPADPRASDSPRFLYVKYGNICNLKCAVCSPMSSTRWIEEWNSFNPDYTTGLMESLADNGVEISRHRLNRWLDGQGDVDRQIEMLLPHLCEITISGGEPFLSDELNGLMRRCVETGHADHMRLKILTNGTVPIAHLMDGIINRFRDVMLWWSVDGVEDQFDYQRFPARWRDVRATAVAGRDAWAAAGVRGWMGINITVSGMNVLYLPDYEREFHGMGFTANINPATNDHISHADLPLSVRGAVAARLREHDIGRLGVYDRAQWDNILADLEQGSGRDDAGPMRRWLAGMDRRRGNSYAAAFPEMASMIGLI